MNISVCNRFLFVNISLMLKAFYHIIYDIDKNYWKLNKDQDITFRLPQSSAISKLIEKLVLWNIQ